VVVLHGSWMEGALHLWAENWSAEAVATYPHATTLGSDDERRRRSAALQPEDHGDGGRRAVGAVFSPYDPGADDLGAALVKIPDVADNEKAIVRTAWLPTVNNRPVHSRKVWQFADAAPQNVTLAPWHVTAIPLSRQTQFALLGACREDRRLASGVVAGQDLLAWADLFRYAGALVARAAFLPALVDCGTHAEARWQPAFDGGDRHRLFLLAAQLPSVARCLTPSDQPFAAVSAADVVEAFVTETVDRLVRFSAVTTLSRAHASKGRYFSAHDAWLAALRGEGRVVRW